MSDHTTDDTASAAATRMPLGPDELHEGEEEPYVDCPSCGSPAPLSHIILEGTCTDTLAADTAEAQGEDTDLKDAGCGADLSLELVWSE